MKQLLRYAALVALLGLPLAAGAAVDCSTQLGTLQANEFKPWIEKIKSEDCARTTLAEYPQLELVETGNDLIAVSNAYYAAVRAFLSILPEGDFDPEIVEKVNSMELENGTSVDDFKPVLFAFDVPTELAIDNIRGLIKINRTGVGPYSRYVRHCIKDRNAQSCARWEKTARLFGGMIYLTAGYRQAIIDSDLENYSITLDRYIGEWEKYFEQRKPQLPWEIAANQVWNRDLRRAEYFAGPPTGDWILFHPSLVYSRLGEARDGDKNEMALAIELVGYNRWDRTFSGVSVVAVNSDRAGIEDTGYGLMLHFKSHYSLGWSSLDDEDLWFISIDLLNAVDDKRTKLRAKQAEVLQRLELLKSRIGEIDG